MIYRVRLSNGSGDHVDVMVVADDGAGAERVALAHLKSLPQEERSHGLNGAEPDMVRVKELKPNARGVFKTKVFNHEMGGW